MNVRHCLIASQSDAGVERCLIYDKAMFEIEDLIDKCEWEV